MAPRDLRQFAQSPGPLRDMYSVTIGTDDFLLPTGFLCVVTSNGDLTFRTLFGENDQTISGLAGTTTPVTIGLGTHPVLLGAIRGSSTAKTFTVGIL